jgi:hypothetical protein
MPHPRHGYRLASGRRVKGATYFTGRYQDGGSGLDNWKKKLWLEGLDPTEERDKAATVGTTVHAYIETRVNGQKFSFGDFSLNDFQRAQVQRCIDCWEREQPLARLEVVEQEVQLVSEQHRYGGTMDTVARDSEKRLWLVDYKTATSLGIYARHKLQLRAYGELWNENREEQVFGYCLLVLDKVNGGIAKHALFHDDPWSYEYWRKFRGLLMTYGEQL